MAYDFLQADNRNFFADNQITSIGVPMTVSIRQRYPNTSANRNAYGILRSTGDQNDVYSGGNFSPNWRSQARGTNVSGIATVALPGTNQWFNAVSLYASTTSRTSYVNETAGTPNTDSVSVSGEISIYIGRAVAAGAFTGQLSEFAIWNAALNDAEINSLAKGFKPPRIRPQSLLYYVPLVRDVHELRSGITFTASANAPTVFDHPRVY